MRNVGYMAEVYEKFVKEYLELKGFLVTLDVPFMKKNWSDIDVVAVKKNGGFKIIIGEVKSWTPGEGVIKG